MKRSTFLLDSWHKRASIAIANTLSTHLPGSPSPSTAGNPAAWRSQQALLKALTQDANVLPGRSDPDLRQHSSPHGHRAYRLYVPTSAPPGPRPLLVMLHGCTQNSADFALGTRMNEVAEERGVIVAYPEQARTANMSLCWNWFQPADQARGSGEPAILASIVAEIMQEHDVDSLKIFVAGLSAGGAMAAVLGRLTRIYFEPSESTQAFHTAQRTMSLRRSPQCEPVKRAALPETRSPQSFSMGPTMGRSILTMASTPPAWPGLPEPVSSTAP